jgi:hypothetical protein
VVELEFTCGLSPHAFGIAGSTPARGTKGNKMNKEDIEKLIIERGMAVSKSEVKRLFIQGPIKAEDNKIKIGNTKEITIK